MQLASAHIPLHPRGSFFGFLLNPRDPAELEAKGDEGPLSRPERRALIKILAASAEDADALAARSRVALESYVEIISAPPLDHRVVITAARALIRVWKEMERGSRAQVAGEAVQIRPATADAVGQLSIARRSTGARRRAEPVLTALPRRRSQMIDVDLLELEPTALTEPMSPLSI